MSGLVEESLLLTMGKVSFLGLFIFETRAMSRLVEESLLLTMGEVSFSRVVQFLNTSNEPIGRGITSLQPWAKSHFLGSFSF